MKSLVLILFFANFKAIRPEKEFFSRAAMGEYVIDVKQLGPCEKGRLGTNELQINTHLTKKNRHTRIAGNFTFLQVFDDNVMNNVNFMILGSNAAWIPNAYKFYLKGCSTYVQFLNGTGFLSHLNIPPKCPILKGIYTLQEYDPDRLLQGSMMPKSFFYGRFKLWNEYTKHNKLIGCSFLVVDFVPKWQRRGKQ